MSSDASLVSLAVYPSLEPGTTPVGLYHDANAGKNHTYGCDVYGRYSLARNRATLWGSYSYVDSESKNVANNIEVKMGLPGIAHHNIRLGATVNILKDKLFANLGFWLRSNPQNVTGYAPTFFGTQTTLENASKWPYEASLNLIYRVYAGLEAFATVHNLTNHKYASIYDSTPYPGETIRGILGLRFRN
jgi:hypothetical protein